jgi:ABC-type sugar transport system ATPase subunit
MIPSSRARGAVLLDVQGIDKSFGGVRVLRDVGFSLEAGRVLGLVGENGAGKSTLMNVLGGVLAPEGGWMRLGGEEYRPRTPAEAARRGIAFIHQELNLHPNLSVAENVFLSCLPRRRFSPFVDRGWLAARTREVLSAVGLAVSPWTPVAALASGERQLVEIARAVAADARVVILDEPTTSLESAEIEGLFALLGRLKAEGRALIYISHVLGDVLRQSDDVLVLRDGAVVASGLATDFDEAALIRHMVGRALETVFPPRSGRSPGDPALEVCGLTRAGAFRDVTFTVRRGEVVGLAGLMGAGRTEVLRCLFGLDRVQAGRVSVGGVALHPRSPRGAVSRGLALVTEDRRDDGLVLEASVADNLALVSLADHARGGWIDRRRLARALEAQAEAVSLEATGGFARPVATLSGGNQQKVVLGKWLLTRPSVVLLDEPTRGIDVGARQQVYRLVSELADAGTAVLLVSSEIEELLGLADRILVMHQGRLVAELPREHFDQERILTAALGGSSGAGAEGT